MSGYTINSERYLGVALQSKRNSTMDIVTNRIRTFVTKFCSRKPRNESKHTRIVSTHL